MRTISARARSSSASGPRGPVRRRPVAAARRHGAARPRSSSPERLMLVAPPPRASSHSRLRRAGRASSPAPLRAVSAPPPLARADTTMAMPTSDQEHVQHAGGGDVGASSRATCGDGVDDHPAGPFGQHRLERAPEQRRARCAAAAAASRRPAPGSPSPPRPPGARPAPGRTFSQ